MITPDVGYSYEYFRYYQFMTGHGLIIVILLYFMIVHRYIPTFKTTLRTLGILQVMAVVMLFFNTHYDTHYVYVKIAEDVAHEDTILAYLGSYPWYLINLELLGIGLFILWFGFIRLLYFKHFRQPE
ncbi:ABC transporter permease protein putative [Haloplasma contractile SSD-17B]|uniref:ABC transporter permease protein putative n=2 Tax=Haloplasma TaxID=471824 RepID=U2EED6_9MOLU|nr:ABC transporter permease protein putative [Haloplasma contractile SSD-17B]